MLCFRVPRRLSAWARPRLSATASARFAKTTVSHSQTVISQPNVVGWAAASPVVSPAPISVTNITKLRASVSGFSLRSAAGRARHNCAGSSRPAPILRAGAGPGCEGGTGIRGAWRTGAGAAIRNAPA
ncbi:hypothetical protein Sm713_60450 [Streptomyces sp. TS71-3]|nr:hypothetical protein Sm713_60450 [Streptomyces sp. TS71-3]